MVDEADDQRPNPDALLYEMLREEAADQRGKLFIFLGMCPGVGKTYSMLEAAQLQKKSGTAPLVGIVETHGRAETAALLEGLVILPKAKLEHRGKVLEEFDLDAVLALKPELVLVDELAHTNAPGSRHAKRYQDVLELVASGIDVYTTLNVQHIESQVDVVKQITGVTVAETVPDSILDHADEIEVIDLSVDKLLDRMASGKVYLGERAELAATNFFQVDNLTALREMALRFTAEHVDRDLEDMRRSRRSHTPWKTNARLLVGVGPSPYAESLIRWTRRAATRLGCPWLVVWVEGNHHLSSEDEAKLSASLGLARKLGAEVISVTGDDVAKELLQIARERNVTQIVVGKPGRWPRLRPSFAERIILQSGDIDVCVVRPVMAKIPAKQNLRHFVPTFSPASEYAWCVAIPFGLVSLGYGALSHMGYVFNGLVLLMAIIISSLRFQRGPVLLMAALSAMAWNFFFILPIFTLKINKPHDIIMFVMFFIVALSMGHLTTRLRQREQAERQRQRQTAALLRVTQSAALSAEPQHGLEEAINTISEVLDADVALIVRNDDRSLPASVHPASNFIPNGKEWGVINWSYQNKLPAGKYTDTLPQSVGTWFPLQTATAVMGVIGLKLKHSDALNFGSRQSMEAFALQLALVLEKEHFVKAINQAELIAKSEQLQRTLLDSVSHELKTPLAVIQASIEGMEGIDSPYVAELSTASKRLQRVVNHLLQMTRIEASVVKPSNEWTVVRDIIHQAMEMVGEGLENFSCDVCIPDEMPMVKTDANLLTQAITNILHNATIYTPVGSTIGIQCSIENGEHLNLRITDQGPGFQEGEESRIFRKFYRMSGSPTGGTGLGLSISKALVKSLGGDIVARNRPSENGAEFTINIPVETMPL